MRIFFALMILLAFGRLQGQDSTLQKKPLPMNAQSLLIVTPIAAKDSSVFKTPKYKQGFFCNFEDQLNRKKVPIDFSLGNSKY